MPDYSHLTGWSNLPEETEGIMKGLPIPIFENASAELKGTGKGKTVLLYEFIQKLYPNFEQIQQVSDCTSFMAAHCIDILKGVEIILNGEFEELDNITATEFIYGGSRVNIGGGRINGGGSTGGFTADLINKIGSVSRSKYNKIDLSTYDSDRANRWGDQGVPTELLNIAKDHKVKTVSQVSTYEGVRDAIANGFPVGVCSNYGFDNSVRDKHGILYRSGTWFHAQSIIALDDSYKIPSCLILNSWPFNWVSGPQRYGNEPKGSYWVTADTINEMVGQNDSFVYSNFDGYKTQNLNLRIV